MIKKLYDGNYREIAYGVPDSDIFKRNVFLSPEDAVETAMKLNKSKHSYISVYGYYDKYSSSKDITDADVIFDRLVYDFDLNLDDDRTLLSANGYNTVDLSNMTADEITAAADKIRSEDAAALKECPDDAAIRKYYHDKYEHDYLKPAINECTKVYRWFKDNFNIDGLMFFSGKKGGHLEIILNNPVKVRNVQGVTKFIGDSLKKKLKLKTIDEKVYNDKVRVIRIPTSCHHDTKLYANQFFIDDSYIDIIDKAAVGSAIDDIIIPDNDTSNLEDIIKEIDANITAVKNNKAAAQEIKDNAKYDINHEIPIYDDVEFQDKFLKVYKKGQMNEIGYRLVHLLYRSGLDESDVRKFFENLQTEQDLNKVYSWIDRTYNLDLSNDHVGGLNLFLTGIAEYSDDDDRDSLISYFSSYFRKQDKIDDVELPDFKIGKDYYKSKVTARLVNNVLTEITINDIIKEDSKVNVVFKYADNRLEFNVELNSEYYKFPIAASYKKGIFTVNKTDFNNLMSELTEEYQVPKASKSLRSSLITYLTDRYDYIMETNKPDETDVLISAVNNSPADTSNLIKLAAFVESEMNVKRTSDKKASHYYLNNNPNDFNSPTMDKLTTASLGYILLRDYNIRLPDRHLETVLKSIHGQHKINTTSWEFKDGYYLETADNFRVKKAEPKITSKKLGMESDDKFNFYEYDADVRYFNVPEDESVVERTLKQILIPKTARYTVKAADDGHEYVVYDSPEDTKLYIDFLQRLGASFNNTNVHKKVTMYLGTGDNGKSLLSFILYLIFKEYYYGFTPKQLKNDNFTESMAAGKHILLMDELTKDSINGIADIIKRYSSGLVNTTKRIMYSDDTDEMSEYGMFYMLTNVIPELPTDDPTLLRRVDILRLPNVFTDNPTAANEYPIISRIDLKLKQDIKGLEWLVNAGIKAYKTNPKFTAAQTDIETLSIIKADDHLFDYIYTNTEIAYGHKTYIPELLDGFKEYCSEHNIITNLSDDDLRKEIGKKVRQRYNPNELETNKNGKRWYNIRIKSKAEIESEMTKRWTINEYGYIPEEYQVSGIDRNVYNLIKEGYAVTIKDLKKEYPNADVESIVERLKSNGYIMEYEPE